MLGLVHVYTGDGKGKTTAALGQALRMAGWGYRTIMIQFLKDSPSGELLSAEKLGGLFQIYRFHKGEKGFIWEMNEQQREEFSREAREGFNFARNCLEKARCDLLILDEILGCIANGFISSEELAAFIKNKPPDVELIVTGRDAPRPVLELAHYVSEINVLKHPMEAGIPPREGIEF